MPKYIDVESLGIGRANSEVFENRAYADGWNAAIDIITSAPTADVQEVKHGKWIYRGHNGKMEHAFECSVCERWMFTDFPKYVAEEYPYCHCGARMDSVEGLEDD